MSLKKIALILTAAFIISALFIMIGHLQREGQVYRHGRINSFFVNVTAPYFNYINNESNANFPKNAEEFIAEQKSFNPFIFDKKKPHYKKLIFVPQLTDETIKVLNEKVFFKEDALFNVNNPSATIELKLYKGRPFFIYVNDIDHLCHISPWIWRHDIGAYSGSIEDLAEALSGEIALR